MIPDEHSTPLTGVDRPTNADGVTPIGDPTDTLRIPVIDEQLVIDKQVVATGQVRLIKTVEEDQQTIDIPLLAEQIDVERVAIDQFVDEAPATRQEGDTTIYPVLREEYVIHKRLRLVEEIRVTKRQVSTTDQQTVVLRHERIAVERTPADPFSERTGSGNEPSL